MQIHSLDAACHFDLPPDEVGMPTWLGLLLATDFLGGGAIGSALGGWTYAEGGWPLTMAAGLLLPVLALAYFLTEASELQP